MESTQQNIGEVNDTFLTAAQAANYLNISLSTLKKLIKNGVVRAFKTPGGHYRIHKKELLDRIFNKY